jgi:hypothetical protein
LFRLNALGDVLGRTHQSANAGVVAVANGLDLLMDYANSSVRETDSMLHRRRLAVSERQLQGLQDAGRVALLEKGLHGLVNATVGGQRRVEYGVDLR